MMGSLFCGVRAAAAAVLLFMVRKLCVQSVLLCTAARARRPSIESCQRLPRTIFCDPRRRRAGPRMVLGAPPPQRNGSRDRPGARPESQMQRLHKALPRRAQRCPAGARSACVRREDPC